MQAILTSVPLLIISVILYVFLWAIGGMGAESGSAMEAFLAGSVSLTMFSGDTWHLSAGDLLLTISLILLFIEIVKSTSTGASSIINHGLSMMVFVLCIILFIVSPGFANSVFFLITVMALLDVVAGFTITIVAAKRDLGVAPGIVGTH